MATILEDLTFSAENQEALQDEANRFLPYKVASYLTEPACQTRECYWKMRVVDAEHPTDTKIKNFVRKVFFALAMIACAVLAIFLTLPGIAIRGAASYFQTEAFIYRAGNPMKQRVLQGNQFSYFHMNGCFVPAGYAITNGGVTPWRQRIEWVIQEIKRVDADVVSLNEVLDADAAHALYEGLKEEYPHFYINIGPKAMGTNSGLIVMSRFKMQNPEFTPFPKESFIGRMKYSNMGVFSFDLKSRGRNFARLFVTHMSSSIVSAEPTDEEVRARAIQMETIARKAIQVRNKAVLVGGDFNMREEELQADPWRPHFTKGIYPAHLPTWGGDRFCASLVGDKPSEPLTLDHVMLLQGSAQGIKTTYRPNHFDGNVFNPFVLSDHKGLFVIITLNNPFPTD